MEAIDRFIELLRQVRSIYSNVPDPLTRYRMLYPIAAELKSCMKYISNNYEYTQYNISLETLDSALSDIYDAADGIATSYEEG